jgi:hypothetical protein
MAVKKPDPITMAAMISFCFILLTLPKVGGGGRRDDASATFLSTTLFGLLFLLHE